jgi:antirestriction protein
VSDPVAPRVYAADLAAYNQGILAGVWIDAAQDPEDIKSEIQEMLAHSPVPHAEEWAWHDYEGFGELRLSEFTSIENISRLAKLIEEHGEMFAEVVSHFGGTDYLDEAERAMQEGYQGTYRSLTDWAEQHAEDTGIDCGEPWRGYIDFERWANDAEMGGDIFTIDVPDGVAVFWGH